MSATSSARGRTTLQMEPCAASFVTTQVELLQQGLTHLFHSSKEMTLAISTQGMEFYNARYSSPEDDALIENAATQAEMRVMGPEARSQQMAWALPTNRWNYTWFTRAWVEQVGIGSDCRVLVIVPLAGVLSTLRPLCAMATRGDQLTLRYDRTVPSELSFVLTRSSAHANVHEAKAVVFPMLPENIGTLVATRFNLLYRHLPVDLDDLPCCEKYGSMRFSFSNHLADFVNAVLNKAPMRGRRRLQVIPVELAMNGTTLFARVYDAQLEEQMARVPDASCYSEIRATAALPEPMYCGTYNGVLLQQLLRATTGEGPVLMTVYAVHMPFAAFQAWVRAPVYALLYPNEPANLRAQELSGASFDELCQHEEGRTAGCFMAMRLRYDSWLGTVQFWAFGNTTMRHLVSSARVVPFRSALAPPAPRQDPLTRHLELPPNGESSFLT